MRLVLALCTLAALGACAPAKQLFIDGAYVRLSAVPDRPSSAYFTIHGGPADATLLSVSTDVAIRAEMHESMDKGGTATMTPITRLAIPANTNVVFAPGGRHLMLYNVNPGIVPGKTITLSFAFADGTRILQDANVVAAGDAAPK